MAAGSSSGRRSWRILAAFYIWNHFNLTGINVPFVGQFEIAPVLLIAFIAFVIVGTSNAVNLTDGLDGLAGGVLIFSFVAYLLISLVEIEGLKLAQPNLAIFCALVIGALMGFLWFNVHPATIIMGDSGALSLGATLAVVATVNGQLPLLIVIGIVFFAVIMSVVIQVASYPAARPADLPHDAAPSPLRAHRLGGGEDHPPLLDRGGAGRAARREHLPQPA